MTGAQTAVTKLRDQEPSSTPAEVGKRIIEGVFERQVDDEQMELLNHAMHWVYGTSWGVLYGLAEGTAGARSGRSGALFGLLVWGASLVALPAMKLAPPVWEYPPQELALDLGYHVVYGLGVGAGYAANPVE